MILRESPEMMISQLSAKKMQAMGAVGDAFEGAGVKCRVLASEVKVDVTSLDDYRESARCSRNLKAAFQGGIVLAGVAFE
jgi:hypothetical protein